MVMPKKNVSIEDKNKEVFSKLKAKADADDEKRNVELRLNLSVKERLMRSVKSNTVDVPFNDDLGGFTVKCRVPTWSEQEQLGRLKDLLENLKDPLNPKYDESKECFFRLFAYPNGICLDASLDMTFFKNGCFGMDFPLKLITSVVNATHKSLTDVGSFRKK